MGFERSTRNAGLALRRRDLLKAAGAGALAAAAAPLAGAASDGGHDSGDSKRYDYDAIVIGAGAAGATAARDLGASGMKVLVLEARTRPGGLIFTSSFAGETVELGATWIHWLQPHVWAEKVRYDLPIVEKSMAPNERFVVLHPDGKREEVDPDEAGMDVFISLNKFNEGSREYFPRPYDPLFNDAVKKLDLQSMAKRMDEVGLSERQKAMMSGGYGVFAGGDLGEAAASVMLRQHAAGWDTLGWLDAGARFKFEGGTHSLISALLEDSGAELRTGTPVAAIRSDGGQVVVKTEDGDEVSARAAVVTVPINTYGDIDFRPGLTGGKAALAKKGQMARTDKVWVHISEELTVGGFGPTLGPFCQIGTYKVIESGTLLECWNAGDTLNTHDRRAVTAAVQQYLPEAEVLAHTSYDWNADPFSKGVYPSFRVGELTQYWRDLRRAEGNVFFAGAMTGGWYQYIDGAVESGLRAARDAIRHAG